MDAARLNHRLPTSVSTVRKHCFYQARTSLRGFYALISLAQFRQVRSIPNLKMHLSDGRFDAGPGTTRHKGQYEMVLAADDEPALIGTF